MISKLLDIPHIISSFNFLFFYEFSKFFSTLYQKLAKHFTDIFYSIYLIKLVYIKLKNNQLENFGV